MWDNAPMARSGSTVSPAALPVAHEVLRRMLALGITKKALALEAGLKSGYVHDLFRGKSQNPKTEHLQKLAVALGCTLEDLIDPGSAGSNQSSNDPFDFSDIFPIRPGEVHLIRMWRLLNDTARDRVLHLVMQLVASRSQGRKSNDV